MIIQFEIKMQIHKDIDWNLVVSEEFGLGTGKFDYTKENFDLYFDELKKAIERRIKKELL